ncbi:aconitate hydratase AcnA [Brochothrix campestris]|uniref:aconitate hydratase AcnA n=1 Tax=Brochothrix campestris TaxID=2757 RepID=UPI0038D1C2DA
MLNNEQFVAKTMVDGEEYTYFDIAAYCEAQLRDVTTLPYSIRVLLESVLRQHDGLIITEEHVQTLAQWQPTDQSGEVPFKPARVILQDFTGVPAVVDLAAMRDALKQLGGNPEAINPEVPVDLVIDHSVQVDTYGTHEALQRNMVMEFKRNQERYEFLKWAQNAFDNYQAVPPATGIVHQVNLEFLARVVFEQTTEQGTVLYPDTLVGTDSHTTMVNALGVLGWGVGGIEAEAGMLGQPSYFPVPEVVGVTLLNALPAGATATDLALKVTQVLRQHGVVGKFVEFTGAGLASLTLSDRATIANMAPEYGATCGFFPVDAESLAYLALTGRKQAKINVIERYLKDNHLFHDTTETIAYSSSVTIDLAEIMPNLAGPKRPQDLIPLTEMKTAFETALQAPVGNQGFGLSAAETQKTAQITFDDGETLAMPTGAVAIAAITSCTNTSNPYVLLCAGLIAKRAVELGLKVPRYVKTSLAPGSKVVTAYLDDAGLTPYMDQLGFNLVGYGCTTCIGNSGPLLPEIEAAIQREDLLVSSVLSGNRNFEGRIHPLTKANYLASPPLVVAYALAGTTAFDFETEALGTDQSGTSIYLRDLWPDKAAVEALVKTVVTPEIFSKQYAQVFNDNEVWNAIETTDEAAYNWDETSTYIANPPFFDALQMAIEPIQPISGGRVLAYFGDSVTTDHISPAGAIGKDTPAGLYLRAHDVPIRSFNSYGSRRGHHEVMMRGTFANIRIRNKVAPGTEGGYTTYWPTAEVSSIYDAAMRYKETQTPLVVLAGKDYGMGSSRDWAAKGPKLLGVKAVIAESYERIHRSNLVLMGILPLQFIDGQSAASLGLNGDEVFDIAIDDTAGVREMVEVTATQGEKILKFQAIVRFDSLIDVIYYRNGGILPLILRQKAVQK